MTATESSLDAARRAFASFVAARDGISASDVEIADRDELHTPPYFCFAAIAPGPYLRGLARADGDVLTHAKQDAFARWLRGVEFAGVHAAAGVDDVTDAAVAAEAPSDRVSGAQFVEINRLLTAPDENRYAEGGFPLLFARQLTTAPTDGIAEPLALPTVEDASGPDGDDVRRVHVWWQLEPGARFELWTYSVTSGGEWGLQRRPARMDRPG